MLGIYRKTFKSLINVSKPQQMTIRLNPEICDSNFKYVINHNFPNTGEDCVHPIDRTACLDRRETTFNLSDKRRLRFINCCHNNCSYGYQNPIINSNRLDGQRRRLHNQSGYEPKGGSDGSNVRSINKSEDSKCEPNHEIIEISERCVERLKKVLDTKEDKLRVEVFSGGCSGLQYKFDVCSTSGPDDHIFEKNGVKVVIDSESLKYIKGSTIDYSEELIKSAFRVTNNPQSEQGCSCGASFSLKLDNEFKFKT